MPVISITTIKKDEKTTAIVVWILLNFFFFIAGVLGIFELCGGHARAFLENKGKIMRILEADG